MGDTEEVGGGKHIGIVVGGGWAEVDADLVALPGGINGSDGAGMGAGDYLDGVAYGEGSAVGPGASLEDGGEYQATREGSEGPTERGGEQGDDDAEGGGAPVFKMPGIKAGGSKGEEDDGQ